jgi:hypothetical protein
MKIKGDKRVCGENFTGILEYCDGMDSVFNVEIAYYKNGKLHKENGPARCWHDGTREWNLNDLLHREDGPAREWTHGIKEWWLNGIWINKQKRKSKVEKLKKGRKQKVLSK